MNIFCYFICTSLAVGENRMSNTFFFLNCCLHHSLWVCDLKKKSNRLDQYELPAGCMLVETDRVEYFKLISACESIFSAVG